MNYTAANAPTDPTPCYGLGDLFEAIDQRSHRAAARLCAHCDFADWCEDQRKIAVDLARNDGQPARVVGTWAGTLYGGQGRPRREAA